MSDPQTKALAKLSDLALSDTGFVFDPYSGTTFSVNPTGLALLRWIKEGHDRPELLDRLRAEYETGQADLHRDLDDFMHLLRQHGIVPTDYAI